MRKVLTLRYGDGYDDDDVVVVEGCDSPVDCGFEIGSTTREAIDNRGN